MGPGFFTPAHFKGHGCGARVRGANGPTSPVDCVGLGRRTNETAERKKGETVVEPNETVERKKGEAVVQGRNSIEIFKIILKILLRF